MDALSIRFDCYLPSTISSKTMKTFLFINCRNNKRVIVEAADHDQALRAVAKQTGHLCVMFIKTL